MPNPWPVIIQGDVVATCIHILGSSSLITAFSGGAPTIRSDMVGYQMGDRWIMVSREGGSKTWPVVDRPRVDFQVFAGTRSVSHDLAQVAEAVIFSAMCQRFPTYGVMLSDVKEETGIVQVPDRLTGSSRHIFALRLTCAPTS